MLNRKSVLEGGDAPDLALLPILESHDGAANLSGLKQLETERVVNQFNEIPLQLLIFACPPADRTDFDVGVIRVAMLDFIMGFR